MLPAIERRSGRSRYTSATLSSSSTATRCSPTSTETRSSRFASGSGARRGVSRRRPPCWRRRSWRCETALRSVLRAGVLRAGASSSLAPATAVDVDEVFLRPRPPRLPRRRLGLVGSVVAAAPPSAAAGSITSGSGCASIAGAAASAAASAFLRRRNQGKRKLLHRRCALHPDGERARWYGLKTWAYASTSGYLTPRAAKGARFSGRTSSAPPTTFAAYGAVRRRSYDPAHQRPGGLDGDGEARGGRVAADRGGRRLVRVPRGDARADGRAVSRGRALGLGAPHAADARDQGAPRQAPAGGRCIAMPVPRLVVREQTSGRGCGRLQGSSRAPETARADSGACAD